MWLREHGRVFDWGTLRWCQMQASRRTAATTLETIALDEFGHIQVLDHHVNYTDERDYTEAVVQTYLAHPPGCRLEHAHVRPICDTATLQMQYDVTTSRRCTRSASTS